MVVNLLRKLIHKAYGKQGRWVIRCICIITLAFTGTIGIQLIKYVGRGLIVGLILIAVLAMAVMVRMEITDSQRWKRNELRRIHRQHKEQAELYRAFLIGLNRRRRR